MEYGEEIPATSATVKSTPTPDVDDDDDKASGAAYTLSPDRQYNDIIPVHCNDCFYSNGYSSCFYQKESKRIKIVIDKFVQA